MLVEFLQDYSMQNRPSKQIYKYINKHGPVSRADIIEGTYLNRGKVARSLNELLEKGLIRVEGQKEPDFGRPATLYQINHKSSYIVGINITRFSTRIIIFDLSFNKVAENQITMTTNHTPDIVIDEVKSTITSFMNDYNINMNQLLGVGIGAIGPLDCSKGIILHPDPFLAHGWDNVPIVERIQETFPVTVLLENGANTAVIGEHKQSSTYKNILNMTVGWGWGCGVILNGQLLNVDTSDISGYGHMVVDIDGKECFCGDRGCAVSYTSLYAIFDEIKQKSPEFKDKLIGLENSSLEELLNVLIEPNQLKDKVILNSTKYLGAGIANLATVFHSELVILNGPLLTSYPGYYEKCVDDAKSHIIDKNIQFKKGDFDGELPALGAAVQVFEKLTDDI